MDWLLDMARRYPDLAADPTYQALTDELRQSPSREAMARLFRHIAERAPGGSGKACAYLVVVELLLELDVDDEQWSSAYSAAKEACNDATDHHGLDLEQHILLLDARRQFRVGRAHEAAGILEELAQGSQGWILHTVETMLGLLALERGDRAAAEAHLMASAAVAIDKTLYLRGFSGELRQRLESAGSAPELLARFDATRDSPALTWPAGGVEHFTDEEGGDAGPR